MSNSMLFMHLTLKGKAVPGDSRIKGYEGQIELKSMSWGLTIKDRAAAQGEAKVTKNWDAKELRLGKVFDGASTALFQHMNETAKEHGMMRAQLAKDAQANNAVISLVAVAATPKGEKMPVLLKLNVVGVRIKSVSSRATESGSFLSLGEELVLAYQQLRIDYFPVAKGRTRDAATTFKLGAKEA